MKQREERQRTRRTRDRARCTAKTTERRATALRKEDTSWLMRLPRRERPRLQQMRGQAGYWDCTALILFLIQQQILLWEIHCSNGPI